VIPEIKKILYATDLSKNASYAYFYAVDMARRYDARIVVLHSVEPVRVVSYAGHNVEAMMREAQKEERERDLEEIKKGLQEFCGKMETLIGPECLGLASEIIVRLGHPVEEILKAVDERQCDAIVLGTHAKGFLRQTFLGNVAASVLERTRKPIFVIPLPSEKDTIDWGDV